MQKTLPWRRVFYFKLILTKVVVKVKLQQAIFRKLYIQ